MAEFQEVFLGRCRAQFHRLRGAAIDAKCKFRSRVRIDRPKSVHIGMRVTLEADVWLKIVDRAAWLGIRLRFSAVAASSTSVTCRSWSEYPNWFGCFCNRR